MISSFFISRPRLALVVALLLSISGVIAALQIPLAQYPEVAPTTVTVSAEYSGADAEAIANSVGETIESAINGTPGMVEMSSSASVDGGYSLQVIFEPGTEPELAAISVRNRISQVEATLPELVRKSGIEVSTANTQSLMTFVVYSPSGDFSREDLTDVVNLTLKSGLERIDGVGKVTLFGHRHRAMRIELDPVRLVSLGLSPNDIATALAAQNTVSPAGLLSAPPAAHGQELQTHVTLEGKLRTPEEFASVILRATETGDLVRLDQVAQVSFGADNELTEAFFEGSPAVLVGINTTAASNAVTVGQEVEARIATLSQALPGDVVAVKLLDRAAFVKAMIEEVVGTLILAFGLVSAVVLIFLGRFAAAVIPLAAVPVSLAGAVLLLWATGASANSVTLLGLVLVIGIVVDDAIIVVENVERVLTDDPNLTPVQATEIAMREITGPIIGITLVIVSVFIPVMFLPGAEGKLLREFAFVVVSAVGMSAIVALTISPALAAAILRPKPPVRLLRPFTNLLAGLSRGYAALVRRLAVFAALSIAIVLGILFASDRVLQSLPPGYVPQEDLGYVFVRMQLPHGSVVERSRNMAELARPIIEADPAVKSVATVVGFDIVSGNKFPNSGVFFIRLNDFEDRMSPDLSADAVAARLDQELAIFPEAEFESLLPPTIPNLGNIGGLSLVVQAVGGQDAAHLKAVARHIASETLSQPNVKSVSMPGGGASHLEVNVQIERERLAELGLSFDAVSFTIRTMLSGIDGGDVFIDGQKYDVILQGNADSRNTIEDLLRLNVKSLSGEMIPLSTIASARLALASDSTSRYDSAPSVRLTIMPVAGKGTSSGDVIGAVNLIIENDLPPGFLTEWTGFAAEIEKAGNTTAILFALAALFAYFFLVALYESWIIALPVMISVSVAALGALGSLYAAGIAFDVFAQAGILVLIALSAKNAILFASFAVSAQREGSSTRDAVVEAARLRFRPIVMTSAAFIIGLVPLAFATGAGSQTLISVGVPVLGGMIAATTFGLMLVPMLYITFAGISARFAIANRR